MTCRVPIWPVSRIKQMSAYRGSADKGVCAEIPGDRFGSSRWISRLYVRVPTRVCKNANFGGDHRTVFQNDGHVPGCGVGAVGNWPGGATATSLA